MTGVPAPPGFVFSRARACGPFLRAAIALGACALVSPAAGQTAPTPPGTRIVNVATGSYVDGEISPPGDPQAPSSSLVVLSNAVVTVVAPAAAIEELVLSVEPAGTVAPGTRLTYTLVTENRSADPWTGVVLRLPLDAGLGDPTSIAGSPGALPAPTATGWDAATRTATWSFDAVPAGAIVSVQLVVPVLSDVPADTVVEETGEGSSAESPGIVLSNTVLTPVVPPVIEISKRAERSVASPGDPVAFSLEVRNVGTFTASSVEAQDTLPPGLAYLDGSGRVDGSAVEPIVSADGRALRFPLGSLSPGETRAVRLAARVTALAREGEALNRAVASAVSPAGWPFSSLPASAAVRIVPGPFRREATLVGRVFVDDDGDGISDAGEPGVPGILVALEDGRGAVTDVTGRWHLEGVRPGLHVARLDRDTLPETLRPEIVNADWAGDRGSRFVETRPAALAVADFPVGPAGAPRCRVASDGVALAVPSVTLLSAPGRLQTSAPVHLEHAAELLVERGARVPSRIAVSCDADDGGRGASEIGRILRERVAARVVEATAGAAPEAAGRVPGAAGEGLEALVREAPATAAIVAPADGARAAGSSVSVDVVYPLGSTPSLSVNGVPVPASRIGATSTLPSRGVAASRYVGVPLTDGKNRIELRAIPPGASPEAAAPVAVTVGRPGRIAGLRIAAPGSRWIADSATPGLLEIEANDGAGMRVSEAPALILEVEGAVPLDPDADPATPGFQVRLADGAAAVRFAPQTFPGRVRARATWEDLEAEILVDVLPAGGRWRVAGLAEGRLAGEGGVEGDGGGPPGLDDDPEGDGGRLAFVARGPVGRASRLTVSVDTARERDRERLSDTFEPDRYFPIWGDTSVTVDEARRQGPVFARMDSPRGFAQYGEVATGFDRTELSRYDRRFEGASGRASLGRTTIEGFAASTDQTVVRDVLSPDGTSGPYLLSRRPVVARSERVVLEVRDRERTDEVLSRQVKLADLDYDLDPEAGTILFRGPVPPFDAAMNPFRIVVLYEARGGGDSQIAAGARVTFRPTDRVESGVSAVREQREGDDLELYGADLVWRPGPGTSVRAEIAATDEGGGTETASRLEVRSRPNAEVEWEVSWRDVPSGFANPTLLAAPEIGSRRMGGSVLWEPGRDWRVKGEAFRQQDDVSGIERSVAEVDAERRLGASTLFGGLTSVASDGPSGRADSSLAEIGARGMLGKRWLGEVSHRQVLGGETAPGYPSRTAVGLACEIAEGQRLVLRHEIESGDGPARDRTSLGLESSIGANTKAHARYELAGGGSGATLRSTTGIETVLPLGRGASLSFLASRVETERGSEEGDFSTLGAGFEKRFGDSIVSSRYEIHLAARETRHVATASGAFRLGEPWTAFVRERIFVHDPEAAGTAAVAEGLFGLAYRPVGRLWQALVRLDQVARTGTATTAGGVVPGSVPTEPASGGAPAIRDAGGATGIGTLYDRAFDAPDSIALNVAAGAQLAPRHRIAVTGIARRVEGLDSLGVGGSLTWLLGAHYTAQIRPRWTLGGSVRRFAQNDTGTATYGAGIEVGWLAIRNLWLTGGYNVLGFETPYAASDDGTRKGPFVSLRFKFDERSLENLKDLRLDRR